MERLTFMKAEQNIRALGVIRKAGKLTRQELAQQLEISQSQATKLAADLASRGLIFESGKLEVSSSGRKADWLALAPEAAYAVGVHLSNNRQMAVVTNLVGEVVGKISEQVNPTINRNEIISELKGVIERAIQVSKVSSSRIAGVGLALSDMVDPVTRTSYGWPDTPGWSAAWTDFPVGEALEAVLPFSHILVDDIVRTLGLAEARYGQGRHEDDFIFVLADHGIGMAILLDGRPYIGHSHIAGELAHIPVGPSTEPCSCGNLGCLHTQTGIPHVLEQIQQSLEKSSIRSRLRQLDHAPAIEEVFAAAENGDKLAIGVLTESGETLGKGMGMIINLMGPGAFILGGALSHSEHFVEAARRSMKMHSLDIAARGVRVVPSGLDEWSGARGAATQVLDELFSSNDKNLLLAKASSRN
jgi:predicted NBD/HSP70 family sugar kinase